MSLRTYFDFAENDYLYFVTSCERGDVANIMGAIAQGICEKYMKHLIDQFDHPTDAEVVEIREKILHDHNLTRILRYIKENMDVKFDYDAVQKMKVINGYYLSARYPGDFSPELTAKDIEDCLSAVQSCREATIGLIEILEKKHVKPKLADKIEAARAVREAQSPNPMGSVKREEREN